VTHQTQTKFQLGFLDSINITSIYGGRVQYVPGDVLHERVLSDFEFVRILEGSAFYYVNGEKFSLKPNSVVFGKPGNIEKYIWDTAVTTLHSYFHFSLETTPRDLVDICTLPHVIMDSSVMVRSIIEEIVNLLSFSNDDHNTATTITRALALLLDRYAHPLIPAGKAESELPLQIQRAAIEMRTAITEQRAATLTLGMLAEKASTTKNHLCKLFKNHTGNPPLKVLRLMQVQLALGLLVRSSLTVQEISFRCGFADPQYFSRYFKAVVGSSPKHIRNKARLGETLPDLRFPQGLNSLPSAYD